MTDQPAWETLRLQCEHEYDVGLHSLGRSGEETIYMVSRGAFEMALEADRNDPNNPLRKELDEAKKREKLLRAATDRHLPCPDHRDKFNTTEDGCPYCALDKAKKRIAELEEKLKQNGLDNYFQERA